MAKRLLRTNPVSDLYQIAEELAVAGHLNERRQPYNAMSVSWMLKS